MEIDQSQNCIVIYTFYTFYTYSLLINIYTHNSYVDALRANRICEAECMMLFLLIRKSCKNCKMCKIVASCVLELLRCEGEGRLQSVTFVQTVNTAREEFS